MSAFARAARRLSGAAARVLGWTPATFWAATPAELASALGLDEDVAALGEGDVEQLRDMMGRDGPHG